MKRSAYRADLFFDRRVVRLFAFLAVVLRADLRAFRFLAIVYSLLICRPSLETTGLSKHLYIPYNF